MERIRSSAGKEHSRTVTVASRQQSGKRRRHTPAEPRTLLRKPGTAARSDRTRDNPANVPHSTRSVTLLTPWKGRAGPHRPQPRGSTDTPLRLSSPPPVPVLPCPLLMASAPSKAPPPMLAAPPSSWPRLDGLERSGPSRAPQHPSFPRDSRADRQARCHLTRGQHPEPPHRERGPGRCRSCPGFILPRSGVTCLSPLLAHRLQSVGATAPSSSHPSRPGVYWPRQVLAGRRLNGRTSSTPALRASCSPHNGPYLL